jgi:hypothetical protein
MHVESLLLERRLDFQGVKDIGLPAYDQVRFEVLSQSGYVLRRLCDRLHAHNFAANRAEFFLQPRHQLLALCLQASPQRFRRF